jgi:uncharacterized protein
MNYLKKIRKIVKKKMLKLEGTSHAFDHVQRVYKIATYLAKKEGANVEIVQTAALLHDIGRVIREPHQKTGAVAADKILKEIIYPDDKRKVVSRIILHHSLFEKNVQTLEEKIIWDADKIDLIGILGILRIFHFHGNEFDPFDHVVEKWFKVWKNIYKMLFTKTAKKIAKERYKKTLKFSSDLKKEIYLKDLRLKE